MTRDRLIRILLRLGIVFVALQIAAFLVVFAIFMYMALGGDMIVSGDTDLDWWHPEIPR